MVIRVKIVTALFGRAFKALLDPADVIYIHISNWESTDDPGYRRSPGVR